MRTTLFRLLLSVLPVLALAPSLRAQEPAPDAEDPAVAGAKAFLEETLTLVEKGKWKEYKAKLHPFAIKAIEERKTRTKRDDHNLAFWTHAKEWKFQKWEVVNVEPGPRGTAIATTREDIFMIEEKGVEEGKDAEWLLVKVAPDGKGTPRWWVLDRRNGTSNYTSSAIEKGFGDVLPKDAVAPAEAPKTPLAAYTQKLEKAIRAKLEIPTDIPEGQLKVMTCSVKVMVDESGAVLSRTVSHASGNPGYDKAITRAVDAAQPLPAPDNNTVEAAKKGIIVEFKARP